ncbi:serine/threonine-protein kinase bud32 [Dendryphion nanum]|uniref:EKC/KEOPS complex subunit BUD32 n=1 Tax=Dendryphion nanum TaxID=256645 RepID=A0A9P9E7C0_9PLEO|nr:serine/threonine-protein kinase bud32 [Dendryphion nanum]
MASSPGLGSVPAVTPEAQQPRHTLPSPFTNSNLEVLTQGAEALVYRTTFLTPNTPCVLKYRPPKPYRHPTLDKRLTKARILAEARVLVRVRKEGVKVPAVLGGDWENGWLVLEFIEGRTVRRVLDEWVEQVGSKIGDEAGEREILDLMGRIGRAVGKLHEMGVCHGDLTTSNLMLRPPADATTQSSDSQSSSPTSLAGDIILIDFGLAVQATKQSQDEDRAVDLYVLERAFAATHPSAEPLFQEVLRTYGQSFSEAKKVLKRLADVRLRGRKRSMLG